MKSTLILRDDANRKHAINLIANLNLSKPWEITVTPYRKKRSLNQNSMYWKWIGIIAAYSGHSIADIHLYCKGEFLTPKISSVMGKNFQSLTTTNLSTLEMSEFMTAVNAWATSELGLFLPVPEAEQAG